MQLKLNIQLCVCVCAYILLYLNNDGKANFNQKLKSEYQSNGRKILAK